MNQVAVQGYRPSNTDHALFYSVHSLTLDFLSWVSSSLFLRRLTLAGMSILRRVRFFHFVHCSRVICLVSFYPTSQLTCLLEACGRFHLRIISNTNGIVVTEPLCSLWQRAPTDLEITLGANISKVIASLRSEISPMPADRASLVVTQRMQLMTL